MRNKKKMGSDGTRNGRQKPNIYFYTRVQFFTFFFGITARGVIKFDIEDSLHSKDFFPCVVIIFVLVDLGW